MAERKEKEEVRRGGRGPLIWGTILAVVSLALAVSLFLVYQQWQATKEMARRTAERINRMCIESARSAANDLEKASKYLEELNFKAALTEVNRASTKVRETAVVATGRLKEELTSLQMELGKLRTHLDKVYKDLTAKTKETSSKIREVARKLRAVGGAVRVEVKETE